MACRALPRPPAPRRRRPAPRARQEGFIINPYAHGGAGGGGAFLVDSADFDGTNDHVARGAQLGGIADSKLLTVVFWIRVDTWTNNAPVMSGVPPGGAAGGSGTTASRIVLRTAANRLQFLFGDSGNILRLDVATTNALATGTWYCVMFSVDLANTSKRHLYVGDANELTVTTYIDAIMDFTVNDWSVGAEPDGAPRIDAQFAEFWYAPGVYIDFLQEANRRLFYSSAGKPVNLGADGSAPTGTAPIAYLHLDDGEAAANFATNRGTGGNLAVTGALTTGATSPSD